MSTITLDIVARDFASGTLSKVGLNMGTLQKSALGLAGGVAVGGIVKAISLAKDYDLTIRQVGVQAGVAGPRLQAMGALAMKMGAQTKYSAQDAASAMLELAKGGLTAAQIRAGALSTTMTLAAAGGIELADAAGYVTQGMTTFGLSADKAGQVATALAGGANASTASVESLGQALSQVGPGAKTAGLSIQETVAALSAFDNAGIKGSDAGTSLKTMLQRLTPTTAAAKSEMKDLGISFTLSSGQFKSLADISQVLHDRLGSLTPVQRQQALTTIFGSDATRAATVLMGQGAAGIEKYTAAASNQATVQKMAKTSMEGAWGALEQFTGSLETAGIKIGTKLLPAFTDLAEKGADAIDEVMTWGPGIESTFGPTLGLAKDLLGVVKPLASGVGFLASAFGDLPDPLKSIAVQGALAALVFPRIASGVQMVGGRIGTASMGLASYSAQVANAQTRSEALRGGLARMGATAGNVAGVGGMLLLAQGAQHSGTALGNLSTIAGGAATGFAVGGPWGAAIGAAGGALFTLAHHTTDAGTAARLSKGDWDELTATFDKVSGAATLMTEKTMLAKYANSGLLKTAGSVGLTGQTLVDATMGKPAAIAAVREAMSGLNAESKKLKDTANQATPNSDLNHMNKLVEKSKDLSAASAMLGDVVGSNATKYKRSAEAGEILAAQNADLTKSYLGVPARVFTQIKAEGIPNTLDGLVRISQEVGLTPKQMTVVAHTMNFPLTLAQAQSLATSMTTAGVNASDGMNRGLKQAGNVRPLTGPFLAGLAAAAGDGKRVTASGAAAARANLGGAANVRPAGGVFTSGLAAIAAAGRGISATGARQSRQALGTAGNVKPNMAPYVGAIRGGVAAAQREANKASSIGSALRGGVLGALGGLGDKLAGTLSNAIAGAIAAAKNKAQIKSPSRVMWNEIGVPLGQGAVLGLASQYGAFRKAGEQSVVAALAGAGSVGGFRVPVKVDPLVDGALRDADAMVSASRGGVRPVTVAGPLVAAGQQPAAGAGGGDLTLVFQLGAQAIRRVITEDEKLRGKPITIGR